MDASSGSIAEHYALSRQTAHFRQLTRSWLPGVQRNLDDEGEIDRHHDGVWGKAITFTVNLILNAAYAAYRTPPLGNAKQGYTQTAQERFTALATIDADLADIVADYQKKVLNEVRLIQDNVESFLAMCGPGGFSQRVNLPLTDQSANIYRSLELFVLSEALTASGVVIVKSVGIDPRTVPANYCPGLGPAGNCFSWWYDEKNGNTYTLHDPKKGSRDWTDLINYIWDEKLVADMAVIFRNEDCQGKTMPPAFELDNPDPSQMCLITVKNCEAYYATGEQGQSLKQFKNCDKDKTFFTDCNEAITFHKRKLPISYLGPFLHKGTFCRA
ncbi:hypothetical protein EJ03DRAFT_381122 [Teratosphaeria nubilosa]|uniref:Uncharacterized protein n=1 Tax=Teratosphaeria nubilosa TaxID=161662 RepID=A0A6G1LG87_9PEZI|nr:hypothetical protein EJ03DRAFT_381122 [Teratosphaeria nubilosa]